MHKSSRIISTSCEKFKLCITFCTREMQNGSSYPKVQIIQTIYHWMNRNFAGKLKWLQVTCMWKFQVMRVQVIREDLYLTAELVTDNIRMLEEFALIQNDWKIQGRVASNLDKLHTHSDTCITSRQFMMGLPQRHGGCKSLNK